MIFSVILWVRFFILGVMIFRLLVGEVRKGSFLRFIKLRVIWGILLMVR